jgi:hypothetical protein
MLWLTSSLRASSSSVAPSARRLVASFCFRLQGKGSAHVLSSGLGAAPAFRRQGADRSRSTSTRPPSIASIRRPVLGRCRSPARPASPISLTRSRAAWERHHASTTGVDTPHPSILRTFMEHTTFASEGGYNVFHIPRGRPVKPRTVRAVRRFRELLKEPETRAALADLGFRL